MPPTSTSTSTTGTVTAPPTTTGTNTTGTGTTTGSQVPAPGAFRCGMVTAAPACQSKALGAAALPKLATQDAELRRKLAAVRKAKAALIAQLARDRAQQRMRDRCRPHRPQPAQLADRFAEHRVGREPLEELRVVILQAEDETRVLDACLAVGAHADDAVATLPGADAFEPIVD